MRASLFEPRARKVLGYKAPFGRSCRMSMDMEQMDASEALSRWDWREDAALGSARSPGSESFESACSSPDSRSGSGGCEAYGHKSSERQKPKVKMSMKRRMKASEREKLRMRSLAEALHQLRDYLPPVFSRRAQPLTKIQTLNLTIQYINQLSGILQQHDAHARNSRERSKPTEEPGKTPRTRDVPTSSTCHWQD